MSWSPVTGDDVTVRTVEITGPIGPCGIDAEATGEQERISAERKAWARLVRASRRNQQEDLGVSVELAEQDLRRLGVDVDTLLDEAT